jgi:adenosylcobinamide kinase / adenosylcobinamide-phosphate guanylyltransferase
MDIHLITLVLGGARSGKTRFALAETERTGLPCIYVATAEARDSEMEERIRHHRAERGKRWQTVEAPLDLSDTLERLRPQKAAVMVDCMTLWLSNLMFAERNIDDETERLIAVLARVEHPIVLVSNEVGLGIVPDNALARRFRDLQGRLNQAVATRAHRVAFVAAGLPLWLKGSA